MDTDDVAEAYARRDATLERLYKAAPHMRPPAPSAVARPAEPPEVTLSRALLGDKRANNITALAAGLAGPIKDHVAEVVAAGIRPLIDRLAELEARVTALEAEQAELRSRPHLRVV